MCDLYSTVLSALLYSTVQYVTYVLYTVRLLDEYSTVRTEYSSNARGLSFNENTRMAGTFVISLIFLSSISVNIRSRRIPRIKILWRQTSTVQSSTPTYSRTHYFALSYHQNKIKDKYEEK